MHKTRCSALVTVIFALPALAQDTSLEGLQARIVGTWTSSSCEVRPRQNAVDPSLAPTPPYLTRDLTYQADGTFAGSITVFADPACSIPAASYDFAGELVWHDADPAVEGAWSQDYRLDTQLELNVREDTPNMLSIGGKHVDGTGFHSPENRPIVGLQQPLIRVS